MRDGRWCNIQVLKWELKSLIATESIWETGPWADIGEFFPRKEFCEKGESANTSRITINRSIHRFSKTQSKINPQSQNSNNCQNTLHTALNFLLLTATNLDSRSPTRKMEVQDSGFRNGDLFILVARVRISCRSVIMWTMVGGGVSCLVRSEKGEVRTGEMYWGVDEEWREDVGICEWDREKFGLGE